MDIFDQLHVSTHSDVSLVTQLSQQITWLIASGKLAEGDKLPPVRELAQAIGIHMHTVRAAYHRLEADSLVSMRRGRGTVVRAFDANAIAERHPNTPSFLFGVLLPAPVDVYQPYLEGIYDAAESGSWMPVVCYAGDNALMVERHIHQLIAKQVDGFILTSTGVSASFEDTLQTPYAPPIVYVDTPQARKNSIVCNSEQGCFLATQHLLEHGHQVVGLITAPLDWENVRPCFRGYQQALESRAVQVDPELIEEVEDFRTESGYSGMLAMMAKDQPPRAVFVVADSLALGAMRALDELGLKVPTDVAIASFNDIDAAGLVKPGLTSARFPGYEIGVAAVKQLESRLSGREVEGGQTVFDSQLVIRQSCGCP